MTGRYSDASLDVSKNRIEHSGEVTLHRIQVSASPVAYEYWAEYNATISYYRPRSSVAQDYSPTSIRRGEVEESNGKVPSMVLAIGGADQTILSYLESNDALRGYRVDSITVPIEYLANASACTVDTFYIDGCTVDHKEEYAEFELSSEGAVHGVTVPLRQIRRDQCSHISAFKGADCKYAGADTTCGGTKAACKAKNNLINFGAFPGVGTRRVTY